MKPAPPSSGALLDEMITNIEDMTVELSQPERDEYVMERMIDGMRAAFGRRLSDRYSIGKLEDENGRAE